MATGGGAWRVRLWDIAPGHIRPSAARSRKLAGAFALSPDGSILSVHDIHGTTRLCDLATGRTRTFKDRGYHHHSGDYRGAVAFSPDGRWLATSGYGRIQLLLTATGEIIHTLDKGGGPLAFSPTGTRWATGSDDGIVRVWDCSTGEGTGYKIGKNVSVTALAFSRDGTLLAAADEQQDVRVCHLETGRWTTIARLEAHTHGTGAVAFSPNGRTLAAADGASVRVWDTGMIYRAHTTAEESTAVSTIALAPSGALLAVGHNDGILELRNAANGQLTRSLEGGGASVRAIAFSHDGSLIAEARDDRVQLWNHESGRVVRIVTEGKRPSVAFSPDGTFATVSDGGSSIRIWEPSDDQPVESFRGHKERKIGMLVFSPDGKVLATTGPELTAQLWTLASGRRSRLYVGGDGSHNRCVLSQRPPTSNRLLEPHRFMETALAIVGLGCRRL